MSYGRKGLFWLMVPKRQESIMARKAWQQVPRAGSLKAKIFNDVQKAERIIWKWGEAMNSQNLSAVMQQVSTS